MKKFMTLLLCTVVLSFAGPMELQSQNTTKDLFIRVYDMQGKKIAKGYVLSMAEDFLVLKSRKSPKIMLNDIGYIKTKRSAGHNVLVGATTAGVLMAGLGAATADPSDWIFGYTAAEGAAIGLAGGALIGSAIGGLTSFAKNSRTFVINGDSTNWKSFKETMGTFNQKN